jgi:hypothetical protein
VIEGVIDRRILANYRVEPDVLRHQLPSPFKPKLIHGWGVAGICLIRLKEIRPKILPLSRGIGSEDAAHRIAVEWQSNGRRMEGVYISRRDTSSRLNAIGGGGVFPGEHHHARFCVKEEENECAVSVDSDDGQVHIVISGRVTDSLPQTSTFTSLSEASEFFEQGSLGYSATSDAARYDGLELCCKQWQVLPLDVSRIESSFFDDTRRCPPDSAHFDCALLMRGIEHEWRSREDICCRTPASSSG